MKTCSRVLMYPQEVKTGTEFRVTGVAQIGVSGLKRVQYWLQRENAANPPGDPYFTKAPWIDAEVFGPPTSWGGGLPQGRLPDGVRGFDTGGKPLSGIWPL